jgi:carbon-monoxide dehydrogenase small subunit
MAGSIFCRIILLHTANFPAWFHVCAAQRLNSVQKSRFGALVALDRVINSEEYARGEDRSPRRDFNWAGATPAKPGFSWGGFGRSKSMPAISMKVNGKAVCGEAEGRTLLVEFLRNKLGLTGTHVGCDTSQCGACVVHVNGRAIKSCTALAMACDGAEVVTIEGLAKNGKLHPMQEAFREHHGLQCGFCTPGMIMAAVDIVKRNGKKLSEDTIRHELEGNICRCTGYHNIVKAVQAGAEKM